MDKVKQTYEANIGALVDRFMNNPWDNKEFYAEYIAQTYYYVCHSTKLLKYAADHCDHPELKECLLHHVKEELGHEQWCLKDLINLGYDIKMFPESRVTRAMYQALYDGIDKMGPAPIIGYAIALEGMSASVCPPLAPILIKNYGDKSAAFIKNHAVIDQAHAAEGYDILKYLTRDEKEIVCQFIKTSCKAYIKFFDDMQAASFRQSA